MPNITDQSVYEPNIYQIATTDPLLGGQAAFDGVNVVSGYLNASTQQLANRTKWLNDNKQAVNTLLTQLSLMAGLKDTIPYFSADNTFSPTSFTAFARNLLSIANSPDFLTAIGASGLASPAFTGVPTAPTATAGNNTQQIATTAFVDGVRVLLQNAINLKANISSPAFTGTPTAPTPATGTNTTQLATTAMIQSEFVFKQPWVTYTPTVTATNNTFTSASATGKYVVIRGICYFNVTVTVTTRGTGTFPVFTVPFAGITGLSSFLNPAMEVTTNGKSGNARFINTTQARVIGADGADLIIADGNQVIVSGWYPIA